MSITNNIETNLMAGGEVGPEYCFDLATDQDIWEEQTRYRLQQMSKEQLIVEKIEAACTDKQELFELICDELDKRFAAEPKFSNIGSKDDPSCPGYCGPKEDEYEDLRKAKLEFATEDDELPF